MDRKELQLTFTPDELRKLAQLLEQDREDILKQMRRAKPLDTLINLTGHPINVYDNDRTLIRVIQPDPHHLPCKAKETKRIEDTVCGIPLWCVDNSDVVNLPDPKPHTYYIVSRIVASVAKHRRDLLVVDMQIRDDSGNIIGCRGLTRA